MKIKFFLTITLFVFCTFHVPQSFADISITERDSLISLYDSTNGDSWTQNSGWKGIPGTECSWFGVTCNNDHVTEINLASNDLTGSIPDEIGDLTNLEYLNLDRNHLTGEIPPELGMLSNLTFLWLCENQLKGDFPLWIENLTDLESLCLAGNMLSGSIPVEIGSLINLKYLSLWGNLLYGSIPEEIGDLEKLEELYIAYCNLVGPIPETIGNLINLQKLVIMKNHLIGPIPSQLKNLTNLVDSGSDLRWNSLCTNDSDLREFLITKQRDGGDWESTQLSSSYPAGDISCDAKIDLVEAINALQVTAGFK